LSRAAPTLAVALLTLGVPAAAWAQDEPRRFPSTVFEEGADSAAVTVGDVTATVTMERRPEADPDLDVPVLTVQAGGKTVLETVGVGSGFSFPATEASIADIDAGNARPEVYFSSYSGGAHCCTQVFVATQVGNAWKAVDAGFFDGDGNLLRDLDGDGHAELVAPDNRFLYAFDAYAASAAPLQVMTVRRGELADVSREIQYFAAHRQWLTDMEGWAGSDRWSSPGFLAGWVVARQRVGEGLAAWNELDAHWDRAADEGEETCRIDQPLDLCPPEEKAVLQFPERLKLFLEQNGYPLG